MVKVVLVNPPIVFGEKNNFGYPPLGILYIASFLQKNGIAVRVIDSRPERYTLEELTREILKEEPKIVGFSAMACQAGSVLEIAAELKKHNPLLKIVVGGSHINSTKEELFSFTENIDFLFCGEAERSFYEFVNVLDRGQSLENINGLIYKKEGRVIINPPSPPIQDLDSLPFPDLGLVDIRKYNGHFAKSLPLTSLMGSRGCPYNCTFCDAYATHGKIMRMRTPRNVVDEMEQNLKKYGIRQFMFKDSNLTVNKKWVHDICSEIRRRGLKVNWTCNTRVNLIDEELLWAMKKSGCYMLLFGIESGNQKILDTLQKEITIEQIRKAVSLCKKVGLQTTGYFMIGNPGETENEALETVKFSQSLGLDLATFGITAAYPGTEIYKWALENNALRDRFWYMKKTTISSTSMREVEGNLNLKNFSPSRQAEIAKKANRDFYLRPSYLLKYLFKIRTFYDIKRTVNSFYDLVKIQ